MFITALPVLPATADAQESKQEPSWVGKTEQELFKTWGAPVKTTVKEGGFKTHMFRIPNGKRNYRAMDIYSPKVSRMTEDEFCAGEFEIGPDNTVANVVHNGGENCHFLRAPASH
jgi:hypothetical protein